jgi:enamine deaminase RidA (YjgF/YER057c/UK114 family)
MKIERHATGPRMSKAVIHGDTVYLAGIVADNPKGKSTAEQLFSRSMAVRHCVWSYRRRTRVVQ